MYRFLPSIFAFYSVICRNNLYNFEQFKKNSGLDPMTKYWGWFCFIMLVATECSPPLLTVRFTWATVCEEFPAAFMCTPNFLVPSVLQSLYTPTRIYFAFALMAFSYTSLLYFTFSAENYHVEGIYLKIWKYVRWSRSIRFS